MHPKALMRSFKFACAAAAIVTAFTIGPVPSAHAQSTTAEVVASSLRARSGPTTASKIVAYVSRGTKVDILGESDVWREVRLPDGKVAWLHGDFLSEPEAIEPEIDDGSITVTDYVVRSPEMVGQRVRVRGVVVANAGPDSMIIQTSPSSNTLIRGPWRDREDLRHLLERCAAFQGGPACTMTIDGTVTPESYNNVQVLNDVDFDISDEIAGN